METEILFQEITQKFHGGIPNADWIHLVILNRHSEMTVQESLAYQSDRTPFFTWPYITWENGTPKILETLEAIRASLDQLDDRDLAWQVLTQLLHKSLAYGAEVMPLAEAEQLALQFVSLFESNALYYSNSTWNKNEYLENKGAFELGFSSWNPCTDATFDSGVIIVDANHIGIAWIRDED